MNTTNNPAYESLHQTALKAPSSSGVYMWRNAEGTVIYVGKAKSLKNRLSSYFSGGRNIKTEMLVTNAKSIEYITTSNEYEAFLLENNLIKKYTPRYNIQLKDGKSYPVLKITKEEFPRFYKTRQVRHDGSTYFGPYPDAAALDTFIDTLYKLYPVRHCRTFKKREAPCMYYHIGRCKAPCCGRIQEQTYNEFIEEIKALLEGKGDETVQKMTAQMKAAAAELKFEKAARIRDGLKALTIMQNQNIVEDFDSEDRDYIAHYREGELVSFTVLKIREGKLLGRDNYRAESLAEDEELLQEFTVNYYESDDLIPPKIYVSEEDNIDFLEKWLSENFKKQTEIVKVKNEEVKTKNFADVQSKNEQNESETNSFLSFSSSFKTSRRDAAALEMAAHNAKEDIIRRIRERGDMPALTELKELLHLDRLPHRIEGFDIAHIGGKFPVASLISFWDGNPDKKNYRYFRLKTTDGIIDDFASMREAATRRYSRLANENADLPDLILIDGGIGQVNAVDGILKVLGLDIPIAGLAKRDEEIWRPHSSKPICLPKRSDALRLLQRVRDETHRFATSRNQTLRTKENTVSVFGQLPHVGPKREKIIIQQFVTLENLAATEARDISDALKINTNEAQEILMAAKEQLALRNETKEAKKMLFQAQIGSSTAAGEEKSSGYTSQLAALALDETEE